MKDGYSHSMDHNPNSGENQVHYSGKNEPGKSGYSDSAGVESGLSSQQSISVKNAESICPNQRPKGRMEKAIGFKLGN